MWFLNATNMVNMPLKPLKHQIDTKLVMSPLFGPKCGTGK